MAKGPDAIQKGIDDEVSMFESIIDSAIESSTLGYDNSVIVALDNLPSPACRIRLEKLYKDAGWQKVDFESSYRDGVWVRLVAPIRD